MDEGSLYLPYTHAS